MINLVSDAIIYSLAEMAWVSTGGDKKTLNRLINIPADRGKLFKITKTLGEYRFSQKPDR